MITRFIAISLLLLSLAANGQSQHLKGYNTAHIFLQFPDRDINDEALELYDALSPDILRFPGGTLANKYRFWKGGYGFARMDLNREENYIESFVRLVRKLETEPKVVYVMNLFEHFTGADEQLLIQENMEALQFLLDRDIDVVAVELGNEFYLYNEIVGFPGQVTYNPEKNNEIREPGQKLPWYKAFWQWLTGSSGVAPSEGSATDTKIPKKFALYERLVQDYSSRIRAIAPEIKLGVPLGNLANQKHKAYNNFILDRMTDVDAYVCHFYGSFNSKKCGKDEACIRQSLNWYVKHQLEDRLAKVRDTGKECWVTEWNALKFGHYGDQNAWIRNSQIHQDYTVRFIELFDQYDVTISTFHKISGPSEVAAYNAIDVDRGQCYPTAIYDVLKEHY